MIKKYLEKHEIKRIHEIIFFIIIITIILFIKVLLRYSDYSLIKNYPYKNVNYSLKCLNYVVENKPTLNEYQKSEWRDSFTYINTNNEAAYIACFKNIRFIDYPPFLIRNFQEAKEYSLQQAFENNLITFEEFEEFFNIEFSYSTNTQNYKINDLLIFNK